MPAWKWMCDKMKNDSLIYQELLDINGKKNMGSKYNTF